MPDIYATITEADAAILEQLAALLELRASDPQQREMRETYFGDLELQPDTLAVEIGCGTGAVTRALAAHSQVAEAVGVDPSPVFLEKARELAQDAADVTFLEGDARELPLEDASAGLVVFHTTLCHLPAPERALTEARRVLRDDGQLAVFDGDYATATLATGDHDPLQACADAAMAFLVHDRFLVRKLPALLESTGFQLVKLRGHSYVESPASLGYMLAIAERGAAALLGAGRIGAAAAEALEEEAHRRSDEREFFGHIAYVSVVAQKRK
ncbi:MAG TPA: methyltransferase domain-containing protein [Gaiellaceae bacterium]|nr:methyltransferase domain-containing protein [Gaiellaceae bacterium]